MPISGMNIVNRLAFQDLMDSSDYCINCNEIRFTQNRFYDKTFRNWHIRLVSRIIKVGSTVNWNLLYCALKILGLGNRSFCEEKKSCCNILCLNTKRSPGKLIKAGHYWPTSETPFEWRFTGRPIVAQNICLHVKYISSRIRTYNFGQK